MIAFAYVGNFLPHLCNDAAALMAEGHWPRQPRVAQLMHLGVADTTSEVANRDLVRARIRDVDFLDHQRSSRLYHVLEQPPAALIGLGVPPERVHSERFDIV